MEAKPLLKHGWIRALLFALTFLVLIILSNIATDRLLGNLTAGKQEGASPNEMSGVFLLIKVAVSLFVCVITVYFFRKLIDKQHLLSLGLTLKNNFSHAVVGFSMGLILLGIGSMILIAGNNLQWTGINFNPNQLITGFVVMLIVAFAEELAFRGYILNNLLQSMNKWMALIYSALLFAVFHINNPGINVLALLNIFLAGMLLGINYIFTKNLWYGIFLHLAWNFYQGSVLGYKVSGIPLKSLLEQELNGNYLLTGGPFGFEGSVITSVLYLLAFLLLAWVYRRREKVIVNS